MVRPLKAINLLHRMMGASNVARPCPGVATSQTAAPDRFSL